jgi:hypothetical protein
MGITVLDFFDGVWAFFSGVNSFVYLGIFSINRTNKNPSSNREGAAKYN